jgi:hypothetical protein
MINLEFQKSGVEVVAAKNVVKLLNIPGFVGVSSDVGDIIRLHFLDGQEVQKYINLDSDQSEISSFLAAVDAVMGMKLVDLSSDKTEITADGIDKARISVKAKDPVSISVDGAEIPVTLVNEEGWIDITSLDKRIINVGIYNGELRNTKIIQVVAK